MKHSKTLITLTLLAVFGASVALAETTRIWWLQKAADTEFYQDSTTIPDSSTTATFGPYTFTHIEIKPASGHTEAFIETRNGNGEETGSVFAINSRGGDYGEGGAKFDYGEEWTFSVDKDFYLAMIRIDAINTAGESMFMKSSAWKNLEITPGDERVLYDAASGTFTFLTRWVEELGDATENGWYDAGRLANWAPLFVPAGTPVTIGAPDDGGVSTGDITWMDFSDTVPEEPVPSYDGLAYIASGWNYYFEAATWA